MENKIKENFSIITNNIINDERLSFGAKGVACYLLSKPENWKFYLVDIQNHSGDCLSKVKRYIKELEDVGFLVRVKIKNDKGQFVGLDYKFNLDYTETETIENRQLGNPMVGFSDSRKIELYNNTNINNTDINNNKDNNIIRSVVLFPTKKVGFIKPNIEEIEMYCSTEGINIDAKHFYYFYESKGWMVGKNKMKDWKAALRTWERKKSNNTKQNAANEFLELGRKQ